AAERQDDAAPQWLGNAARAFAEIALNGVGLLEVGMRGIQHERLPAAKLMGEELLETSMPALGQPRCDINAVLFGRIVIDVEMFGFQNTKIEFLVLDFVLSKVLGGGGNSGQRRESRDQQNRSRARSKKCL